MHPSDGRRYSLAPEDRDSRTSCSTPEVAKISIDLGGDGVPRGSDSAAPAAIYHLHKEKSIFPIRHELAKAVATGADTILEVRLDLHELTSGRSYLGTAHDGEPTYFYAVSLN